VERRRKAGLLGAKAFADESPLNGKVRAVFNFERAAPPDRISSLKPAGSGGWVSAFSRRRPIPRDVPRTTVYMFLPNNTDFSVFRTRPAGLNFAFIGGRRPTIRDLTMLIS